MYIEYLHSSYSRIQTEEKLPHGKGVVMQVEVKDFNFALHRTIRLLATEQDKLHPV